LISHHDIFVDWWRGGDAEEAISESYHPGWCVLLC